MKGYKAFHSDWTCREKKYRPGATYKEEGYPVLCEQGMHFCPNLLDVFNYYEYSDTKTIVAEVEVLGDVVEGPDKCCTNKLRIIRKVPWKKIHRMMGNEVRRTKLYFWLFFAAVCSCVCFPKFQDQSALSLFSRLMFGMSPLSYMGLWKYGAQWFHLSVIQDGIDADTYYGRLCLTVLVLLIPIFLLALRLYYGCIVF